MAKIPEFPASDSWYPHFVSYGETDTMRVLYYAEYFHIFERARNFYTRERGMNYAEIEKRGIILPVREAQCRYRSSIHFDDEIQVRIGIQEWRRASMKFIYEVWNKDRTVLHATGMTEHAVVNHDGKPIRVPDWLKGLFE